MQAEGAANDTGIELRQRLQHSYTEEAQPVLTALGRWAGSKAEMPGSSAGVSTNEGPWGHICLTLLFWVCSLLHLGLKGAATALAPVWGADLSCGDRAVSSGLAAPRASYHTVSVLSQPLQCQQRVVWLDYNIAHLILVWEH